MHNPNCVGIIMDGNRRHAKARGMSVYYGHLSGYNVLKEAYAWCQEAGIDHLIVYAFSTENWKRSEVEVNNLLELFRTLVSRETRTIREKGGNVRFVGELDMLPEDLQNRIQDTESLLPSTSTTLWVALSYGGRREIVRAAQLFANECSYTDRRLAREVDFEKFLWTHGMPDPDIIIRTGGEKRLSNFLPWQCVYSELFFTDTLWPDFSREEFFGILEEYRGRERRKGV